MKIYGNFRYFGWDLASSGGGFSLAKAQARSVLCLSAHTLNHRSGSEEANNVLGKSTLSVVIYAMRHKM